MISDSFSIMDKFIHFYGLNELSSLTFLSPKQSWSPYITSELSKTSVVVSTSEGSAIFFN